MTTIAARVIAACENCQAYTLEYGYSLSYDGKKTQFPLGARMSETRNKDGRVTRTQVRYADGSMVLFRYSVSAQKATLTEVFPSNT